MASNTTFGATIVPDPRGADAERTHTPRTLIDSPALTPSVSRDGPMGDYHSEKPIPPHSPFYTHPPSSNERMARMNTRSQSHFEKDVESGVETPLSPSGDHLSPFSKSLAVESQTECTMWPSKQTLKQQKQATKTSKRKQRACAPVLNCWSDCTKRQKLMIKIVIALLVIGAAVGLGVGISVAVKGAYFTSDGQSARVGDTDPNH